MCSLNADNIYEDITKLCINIFKQCNGSQPDLNVIKNLRAKSYEILIKKSNVHIYPPPISIYVGLLSQCYRLNSQICTVKDMERAESIQKYTDLVMDNDIYKTDDIKAVLSLLLGLQNTVEYVEPFDLYPWTYGKREELHIQFAGKKSGSVTPYPVYPIDSFVLRDNLSSEYSKSYKQRVREAKATGRKVNPYMPKFDVSLLSLEPGTGLPTLGKFLPPSQSCTINQHDYSSGSLCNLMACSEQLDGPRSLRIPKNVVNKYNQFNSQSTLSNKVSTYSTIMSNSSTRFSRLTCQNNDNQLCFMYDNIQKYEHISIWDLAIQRKSNNYRSWLHLGNINPPKELSFATESDVALLLWGWKNPDQYIHLIHRKQLITDLKHLLAGIPSSTFVYNETKKSFEILPNTVLKGTSPTTTEQFCKHFIKSGNCTMRLLRMFCSNTEHNGFIYNALRKTMKDYLFTFRQITLNIEVETEIQLLVDTKELCIQSKQLWHIFRAYTKYGRVPSGSRLLANLLEDAQRVIYRDVQLILYAAIRTCYDVYLRHIEQWLFTGTLYDPHKELFLIENRVPIGNRTFWKNAYTLAQENIPSFMKGIAQDILNCGKNMRLLKDCDANHPLITTLSSEVPKIICCFSSREVASLSLSCQMYDKTAAVFCGESITIATYFKERDAKKQKCLDLAIKKRQENIDKWTVLQTEKKIALKEKKDKDMHVLKQQMLEIEQNKKDQRMIRIREEIEFQQQNDRAAKEYNNVIEEEKQKLINHYKELEQEADSKRIYNDWKQRQMKHSHISSSEFMDSQDKGLKESSIKEEQVKTEEITNKNDELINISTEHIHENILKDKLKNIGLLNTEIIENINKELIDSQDIQEDNENIKRTVSEHENISECETNSNLETPIFEHVEVKVGVDDESPVTNIEVQNNNMNMTINTNDHILHTDAELNKMKCLGVTNNVQLDNFRNINEIRYDDLTDAEKNRLKIMGSDYGLPDKEIRQKSVTELSDAQKNKMKILGTEYNLPQVKEDHNENAELTDAQKNKLKILGSEYNIVNHNYTRQAISDVSIQEINKKKCLRDEYNICGHYNETKNTKSLTLNLNADGLKYKKRNITSNLEFLSLNSAQYYELESTPSVSHMSVDSTPMTPMSSIDMKIPDTSSILTPNFLKASPETAAECNQNGFTFPRKEYNIQIYENLSTVAVNKRLDNYSDFNKFQSKFDELSNKQLEIFKNEIPKDILTEVEINTLDIHNLTKYLEASIKIPLMLQSRLVNSAILKHFLISENLLSHFKSLRQFFFLLDGEFSSSVCNTLFEKMESGARPQVVLSYTVLRSILEHALAVSSSGADPNSSRLSFSVTDSPTSWKHSSPDALSCITLLYSAPWPLSLVLSQPVLDLYAVIFRYLVKVKRISFKLEECFETLNNALDECGKDLLYSSQFKHVQFWRNTMTHFIRSLQSYLTGTVLHGTAWKFEKQLADVQTIDDLYAKHRSYVKKIVFLCLLNTRSKKIMDVFDNSFTCVLLFNRTLHSAQWDLSIENMLHTRDSQRMQFTHPRFKDLGRIFKNFQDIAAHCYKYCDRLSKCGYQPMLSEFLHVLNINDYYDKLLEKKNEKLLNLNSN